MTWNISIAFLRSFPKPRRSKASAMYLTDLRKPPTRAGYKSSHRATLPEEAGRLVVLRTSDGTFIFSFIWAVKIKDLVDHRFMYVYFNCEPSNHWGT